jgi:2-polyprenyl-3-methyl-5-hydroxy-6-metoxy-1,4-benzoquinol methylase
MLRICQSGKLLKQQVFSYTYLTMTNTIHALKHAYTVFEPYSKKYSVDFDRYRFSLELLNKIPNITNKKVLDIGTGIGIMPVALKKLGCMAAGLDYYIFPEADNKMFGLSEINTYRNVWQNEQIQVFNKNIFDPKLPQSIGTFDVIISEATIEHLKDPKKFLQQCHSLLNPGGYLLLTTPNLTTLIKRIRFLFGKSSHWPIESFFNDGDQFTGHWREYTISELCYMCEATGFKVLNTYNKNALAKFKSLRAWGKNLRALVNLLAGVIPGTREMNYVLCQKEH